MEQLDEYGPLAIRVSAVFYILVYACQMAVSVWVLDTNGLQYCDQPLSVYLCMTVMVSMSFMVYFSWRYRHAYSYETYPRLRSLMYAVFLVRLYLGNLWLWNTMECNHMLYRTTLVLVLVHNGICVVCCCFCCSSFVFHMVTRVTPPPEPVTGLSQQQIGSLRTIIYNPTDLNSVDAKCLFCMEDYQCNDILLSLACSHHAHKHCFVTWLTRSNTCPLCRASALDPIV